MRPLLWRQARHGDTGLSLAELVVTMLVTSLILVVAASLFTSTLRQNRVAAAKTNSTSGARIAMEALSRDLRVTIEPIVGIPAISFAGRREIIFYASRGASSGVTSPIPTKIRYWIDSSSGCLRRNLTAATITAGVASWPDDTALRTVAGTCVVHNAFNAGDAALLQYYPLATPTAPVPLAMPPTGTASLSLNDRQAVAAMAISVTVTDPAAPTVAATKVTKTVTLINLTNTLRDEPA